MLIIYITNLNIYLIIKSNGNFPIKIYFTDKTTIKKGNWMFTNVGLTIEMYFKYILRRKWVPENISFPRSHIGTKKQELQIFGVASASFLISNKLW